MKYKSGIIYSASQQTPSVSAEMLSNPASNAAGAGVWLKWKKRLGFLFVSASLAGFAFFLSPYIAGKLVQNKRKGFAPLIAHDIKPNSKKTEDKKDCF